MLTQREKKRRAKISRKDRISEGSQECADEAESSMSGTVRQAPVTLFKGPSRSDISASDMFQPDLLSTFEFALQI
jgi:hypothetical protein